MPWQIVADHFEITGEMLCGGVPQFLHACSDSGTDEQQRLVCCWFGEALCCEGWGYHGWLPFVMRLNRCGLGVAWLSLFAAVAALELADVGVFNIENGHESAPLKTVSKLRGLFLSG